MEAEDRRPVRDAGDGAGGRFVLTGCRLTHELFVAPDERR
jgi:hypothetical protein